MAYDKEFKMKCVNHFALGFTSISGVAEIKKIPKQTLARWIRLYKIFGEGGLEKNKPGAKGIQINETFENNILSKWKERKRSAHKLWLELKMEGYDVSETFRVEAQFSESVNACYASQPYNVGSTFCKKS